MQGGSIHNEAAIRKADAAVIRLDENKKTREDQLAKKKLEEEK